ncbi:MAG: hypothetical protein K0S35_3127, partial [Geminicoccaceae bacterium]|nr:hypothetical protein [Geminicoccaceae bacterium]
FLLEREDVAASADGDRESAAGEGGG